MEVYYYTLFSIFAIILALMVVDPNVGIAISLASKFVSISFQRVFWLIQYHPKNPITNWIMWRRHLKIAKDLENEFKSKENY
jgi:hypothetical protein